MLRIKKYILISFLFCSLPILANDMDVLPEAPERIDVLSNCLACHAAGTIVQNRLNRAQWDGIIQTMQKSHNLWPLSPKVKENILNYLSHYFSPLKQETDQMDKISLRAVNPLP